MSSAAVMIGAIRVKLSMILFSEHGPEETFNRQNTTNGYGLPPVHPRVGSGNRVRSRPGSGSGDIVNAVSNHTTPRNDRVS